MSDSCWPFDSGTGVLAVEWARRCKIEPTDVGVTDDEFEPQDCVVDVVDDEELAALPANWLMAWRFARLYGGAAIL